MGYIDLPVSGGGITIYPNLASFPASAPDGAQGVAADTDSIYIYNASLPGWVAVATPPVGVFISDLTGDVTAMGPGSAAATVAFVGGETAADVATSVQDTQAATDLSTVSTLVKRDASGQTSLDGLNLDGSTSGAISLQAANTTTSYTVKMPAAQGGASTYLQNDGSGNLSWATVSAGVTSVTATAPLASSGGATPNISITQAGGDADKVLASSGTTASWQYAGLGGGSLGTGNVVLGKAKPSALTTGVRNIVLGTGTTFDTVTTASDCTAIGHNVVVNDSPQSVAIGSGSSSPNGNGDSVAIGYNAAGGWYSVVVGSGSSTWTGNNGGQCTIGANSTSGQFAITLGAFSSSAAGSIAIGRSVTASGTNSIAIGNESSTDSLANVLAIGADNSPINTVYLGKGAATTNGPSSITASAVKIQTMRGSGTNTSMTAGTLTLSGSQGTGTGAGGDVIISTAPAGSSGSSLNAHVERLRVTHDGAVKVPNYILSPQLYDEGTETGNFTLNLGANGPCQQVTINAAGPLVITLSNPVTGGAYLIKIIQGATTGTVTWPASVKWGAAGAPVLSSTTGLIDIINLVYDGTNYYGTYALGF